MSSLIALGIVLLVVFLFKFEGILELPGSTLLEKSQLIKSLVARMLFFCSFLISVLAFVIYMNRAFYESIEVQKKLSKETAGDFDLSIIMVCFIYQRRLMITNVTSYDTSSILIFLMITYTA